MIACKYLYTPILLFFIPFILLGQQKYGADIDSLISKADSLYYAREVEASDHYFSIAEQVFEEKFDTARINNNKEDIIRIGLLYADYLRRYRKKMRETIQVSNQIMEAAITLRDTLGIIDSYYTLGASYHMLDETANSYDNFNRGLLLLDKEKHPHKTWKFYRFMADVLKGTDRQKALQNVRMAIKYFSEQNTHKDKGNIYHMYMNLLPASQLDSIEHYAKIYETYIPPEQSYNAIVFYNDLAYRYIENGLFKRAQAVFSEKLNWCNFKETFEVCPDPRIIHTLGVIDKKLGNYDAAITKFEFSLNEFVYFKDYKSMIEVATDLSNTHEKKGNYKKSLDVLKPVPAYKDSLELINLKKEIEKIETRKLLAEKEEVIEDLKVENQEITVTMSKLSLFAYILGVLIIALIVIFGYNSTREKAKIHKLNEKIQRSRLKSLTKMMNPHFLFNCFSTLQNFILNSYTLKASEYMAELSILIRNIMSASDSVYITFEKELTILKSYCSLESVRFDNKFRTEFVLGTSITNKNFLIPSMIIQPFIENAFKHAFTEERDDYVLTIMFEKGDNEYLKCNIIDNGIGRTKAEENKKEHSVDHLSIATGNVGERLQLINRMKERQTKININDLEDNNGNPLGTQVILILPIIEDDQKEQKYA